LQARGSIYNANFADRKSPIAYGYGEQMPVYFNQAPLFQISGQPGAFGGGGGGGGGLPPGQRPSGRGGIGDPDIVQSMPQAGPRPPSRPGEEGMSEEARAFMSPYQTPPALRPRVVLRFASNERELLVSGMLAGGADLAGKPAVVDVPVGQGHVVMFATNPMWRHQTQGAFFLLFNAALNYNHLDAGRAAPPARPERAGTGDEQ
jgi:hypothetical protein